MREGNALYRSGQYEAALREYEAAARELPDSSVIEFNRGNALFKNRDQEQALDRYLAALATDDPALASRAKYNIGVIKYRQALAAAQKYEDALTLAQAAIGYFRDSLRLDPGHADARYNPSWRTASTTASSRTCCTPSATPRARRTRRRCGAARPCPTRSGTRAAASATRPDMDRRPHGQRANEVPENYSNNEEKSKPPEMARLPVAMSPMARSSSWSSCASAWRLAQIRRLEQRRKQLLQDNEPTPW